MLFDEKKMPYHLMLQKFLMSGGQNAFFDAFYWALSIGYSIPPEDGLVADLPEYTGEFYIFFAFLCDYFLLNSLLQVNLCQKLLFLHQLTHNMTTDCSLNYKFNT